MTRNPEPSCAEIDALPYMNVFLKEVLRLYPPSKYYLVVSSPGEDMLVFKSYSDSFPNMIGKLFAINMVVI